MTILTPPEIARRWRCKPEGVRKLIDSGKLPAFNVASPTSRQPRWRVTLAAVEAYEAGLVNPVAAPSVPHSPRRRKLSRGAGGPF
ncbi:helix-turn-helix domain-containing protein [Planctomicrobium sp. SH668]|uniref:helix-turn-helix domain-containing protein n=1 Tax=Planctomicrobium sp. SH668 TaxID=3448126 RepID=UPI003F5BC522